MERKAFGVCLASERHGATALRAPFASQDSSLPPKCFFQ